MKPKVSIIVAVWNGEKYIKETIESLLNQSEKSIEVLVIDDGSTDKTGEIVKSFMEKDSGQARMTDENDCGDRVRYFYQQNSGSPAAPRNLGIKKATGNFAAFCDQEDIWYPDKVERQLNAFNKITDKENIGIVISSADFIDEKGSKIRESKVPFEGFLSADESFRKLLDWDFITACSAMVPRKIFEEVGLLDEQLVGVDDYDLWLRITKKYGILSVGQPLCAWRQHKSSLSADKASQYIQTEKVFEKLELENTNDLVLTGHGKNIIRIFLALVLKKEFDKAEEYREKVKKYPFSGKVKIILSTYDLSKMAGFCLIVILKKMGKVDL